MIHALILSLFVLSSLNSNAKSVVQVVQNSSVLTDAGLEVVRIGMTKREAEHALGAKLAVDVGQDPSGECVLASRSRQDGISYMMIGGKIVRIDVQGQLAPSIRSDTGIHFGSAASEVLKAYGARVQRISLGSDENDYELFVRGSMGVERGIEFYISNERVTWLFAGTYSALRRTEGCL